MPIYGLAPIKLFPIEETAEFPSLMTDNGTNVTYYRSINLWIGLSPLNLIRLGAKFSPCMRTDFDIRVSVIAPIRDRTQSADYGCCQNEFHVGNTLIRECISPLFEPETNSTFFERGIRCSNNNSRTASQGGANFHPCCISITGQCAVMDFEQCEARGGFFHDLMESCDEVCVNATVGFRNFGCVHKICHFCGRLHACHAGAVSE